MYQYAKYNISDVDMKLFTQYLNIGDRFVRSISFHRKRIWTYNDYEGKSDRFL